MVCLWRPKNQKLVQVGKNGTDPSLLNNPDSFINNILIEMHQNVSISHLYSHQLRFFYIRNIKLDSNFPYLFYKLYIYIYSFPTENCSSIKNKLLLIRRSSKIQHLKCFLENISVIEGNDICFQLEYIPINCTADDQCYLFS